MKTFRVPVYENWQVASALSRTGDEIVVCRDGVVFAHLDRANPVIPDKVAQHPEVVAEISRLSKEYLDGLPIDCTFNAYVRHVSPPSLPRYDEQRDTFYIPRATTTVSLIVDAADAASLRRAEKDGRQLCVTFKEKKL